MAVPLRALVFDFDGLICDTEWPEYRSVADAFAEHGFDYPPEEWVGVIGSSWDVDWMGDLEARLGRAVDREALHARRRARKHELLEVTVALPGVVDLIDAAEHAGLGLAVASSSPRAWVAAQLDRIGLGARFDVVVTRDDVAQAKPAPDLFLEACARLGVPPVDAVALEDSAHGATAAVAAGLRCVVVPNQLTCLTELGHADLRLGSMAEAELALLEELVARLAGGPDQP
ncbi:MAG: HAD-IA family hydrolase [Acidimicrobiia bacterium]|nr:HAD-IA family hydrolase [Acidimicrobiia bacterium]